LLGAAPVLLFWIGLALMLSMPAAALVAAAALYVHLRVKFLDVVARIFQEKPLFVIPRGQSVPGAEEVWLTAKDGLQLHGCYLKAKTKRRGVILFGLEYGSTCWSCWPYVEYLVEAGFDVLACEPRSQGESTELAGYEPLQWVTDFEVEDAKTALQYLKKRPDADPRGVGLFGISKGAGAGLLAAAADPAVRCFVTDGVFSVRTTMLPFMRQWIRIYSRHYALQQLIPLVYYIQIGAAAVRQVEHERGCRFPRLDRLIGKLAGRPLLMIHGEGDTYISPDMARALFDRAAGPKELWLVPGARHNQALHTAGAEYRQRVLQFFETHLAEGPASAPAHVPDRDGMGPHGNGAVVEPEEKREVGKERGRPVCRES
jgi:pimeloyl-ACP methyl ester carboxylesterase